MPDLKRNVSFENIIYGPHYPQSGELPAALAKQLGPDHPAFRDEGEDVEPAAAVSTER